MLMSGFGLFNRFGVHPKHGRHQNVGRVFFVFRWDPCHQRTIAGD